MVICLEDVMDANVGRMMVFAGVGRRDVMVAVTGVESPSEVSGSVGRAEVPLPFPIDMSHGLRRAAIILTPKTFNRGASSRAMFPHPMIKAVEP